MLSLLNIGIEPTAPIADSISFFTGLRHLQSIKTDCASTVEKIKDLLATPNNRLYGLILLKIALEQNSDVYVKGKWPVVLCEILNDSAGPNVKEYVCELFCMLLPYMMKEAHTSAHTSDLRSFSKEVFPFLIDQVENSVEWSKAAWKCICTCLKVFPHVLLPHKDHLTDVILQKTSYNVSSEIFETTADCFAELPNLLQAVHPDSYLDEWKRQYKNTLNTLQQLINFFLPDDTFAKTVNKIDNADIYHYSDDDDGVKEDGVVQAYMKKARRFINLSRCLAKMLSTQSRFVVEIPIKMTLVLITRLFDPESIKRLKPVATEVQVFFSLLSQMQLAALVILESLIINLDVLKYSMAIADLVQDALETSTVENTSIETLSVIRVAVWKILKVFLKKYGSSVSSGILKQENIFLHLFADISIEDVKPEAPCQATPKSKKTVTSSAKKKCICISENKEQVCREALEAFEQLIYSGSFYISKERFKDTFSKILQISLTVRASTGRFPSPYNDGLCRKSLYSVLLSLALIANMDQSDFAHSAIAILKHAFQDPSIEVTGFCNIAMAMLNAKIHPKRLPLKCRQRVPKVSRAVIRLPEWTSEDYVSNPPLENAPKVHENITSRSARTFRGTNEGAILQEEPMEEGVAAIEEVMGAEPHYSERYPPECYSSKYEQGTENHNGDDILEIHESSELQDEESDEGEEEEDEDEERSDGDEEINQEDIPPEDMYIPSTSKLQVVNPVHISTETVSQNVSDREYEQLRPSMKPETSNVDSNKNMHLNGVRSIVPDTDVPSSSTQPSLASENGGYIYDEEELEEEELGEEEDEEETASFPAEKRVPVSYPSNPPPKRQKLDNDESKIETQEEEGPRSPTLDEMKADFICPEITEIDDVKS